MNPPASERVVWLDGWRGLSVLMVISSHVAGNFFEPGVLQTLAAPLGHLGVLIFFAISGYVMTALALKERERTGRLSIKAFFARRVLRILPPLLLYSIVVGWLDESLGLANALRALSFTCNLNLPNLPTCGWLLGHTWSLAFEEQFYLLFPFLFAKRTPVGILPLVLFAALPALFPIHYIGVGGFFQIWLVLGLGCAAAAMRLDNRVWPASITRLNLPISLGVAALAYLWAQMDVGAIRKVLGVSVLPLSIVWLAVVAPTLNNGLQEFLQWKPLTKIGLYSYGIYLWQEWFTRGEAGAGVVDAGMAVLFSIAAGALSWHTLERPLRQISRGRFAPDSEVAASHDPWLTSLDVEIDQSKRP